MVKVLPDIMVEWSIVTSQLSATMPARVTLSISFCDTRYQTLNPPAPAVTSKLLSSLPCGRGWMLEKETETVLDFLIEEKI